MAVVNGLKINPEQSKAVSSLFSSTTAHLILSRAGIAMPRGLSEVKASGIFRLSAHECRLYLPVKIFW